MSDTHAASAQLLTQLLYEHSPELGARLKQRLKRAFAVNGFPEFDEKPLGFKRFSDYLLRIHGDLVSVDRAEGVGDILVSLRGTAPTHPEPTLPQPRLIATPVLRSDIWQAFANPDENRLRFFNKTTDKVVHYLQERQSHERAEVEGSPGSFIRIVPIDKEQQGSWMREYLQQAPLSTTQKEVLEPLATEPYSSTVNKAFTDALSTHAVGWRRHRTAKVIEIVHEWAQRNGIALTRLHAAVKEPAAFAPASTIPELSVSSISAAPRAPAEQMPARQQAMKLLELLSDDDIQRLVLPTLLSTILVKSRM
ncbi:hypothetical protein [Ralstonia solanacearum]|uniref:hypothetical protein n=1 Tax=Ralstonia solanacearum TaxID=305 RepID=UPI0023066FFE|nr:hypothetical protein [Ralstonia solanacearum]MDB0510782.1 hypothetical protein [Ralstonia solanacearum]